MSSNAHPRPRPVALVTGGGARLGRALAEGLAAAGFDIAASCLRSAAGAAEAVERAAALGAEALAVRADLSAADGAVRVAAAVSDRFGRLDLLVNSAASFERGDLLDLGADEWDAVMALNLRAPFLLVRETAALLRASRGAVVNIADLSALQPWTDRPHHSVSKAALLHLTRVMARRLAPEVRVNAVAPGYVLPPEHHAAADIERERRRIPMGRVGDPADVLAAVRFLASARYVTGQVVVVDGGLSLAPAPPPRARPPGRPGGATPGP